MLLNGDFIIGQTLGTQLPLYQNATLQESAASGKSLQDMSRQVLQAMSLAGVLEGRESCR
jgi:hypothetical protein